jgi:hypothetical protein
VDGGVVLGLLRPADRRSAGTAAPGGAAVRDGADASGYVRALRAVGIDLPVVLTPGAAPGDVAGSRATITGLAEALGLPA